MIANQNISDSQWKGLCSNLSEPHGVILGIESMVKYYNSNDAAQKLAELFFCKISIHQVPKKTLYIKSSYPLHYDYFHWLKSSCSLKTSKCRRWIVQFPMYSLLLWPKNYSINFEITILAMIFCFCNFFQRHETKKFCFYRFLDANSDTIVDTICSNKMWHQYSIKIQR